jgi:hypothetical protein
MKLLKNIEDIGLHYRALAELDALGDQDNSAWSCIGRIVEVTDLYCRLEESTKPEGFDAFDNWNWDEHHYGVEWRSSWSAEPIDSYRDISWLASDAGVEARITLAGGGPAVRIVAELDGYGCTDKFIVEHANWSSWEQIDLARDDRLPDYVRSYVFDMVGRYIQHVAGWVQEL